MGISIDSIWSKAQRLSASERLALSRKLRDSVNESDVERQERTISEIDRFFGGWNEDPRTTEEIMQQIREGRIMLTKEMKEAASQAERDFEEGKCLNDEAFQNRFAKWL